jgi:hypothetical protein
MTWVEVVLILSVAGVAGGISARHHAAGRLLLGGSLAVLAILAAIFGPELLADLM